ncbi:caudovirus prohead protease [Elizabethkingia anophelis]|nr:caudovirus prohead protease [Elizabethkingia anophelis]
MSKHKFILNDETKINQYGFRVSNSGLDLARFKANPVILDYHKEGNEAVIGRWENIQIEGHLLTAEAVFDDADPNAAKISGKVERGFLKGCSLGLNPFSMSNFVIAPDDVYDLVRSEALEASIVAIPNNANAIKLYASTEESFKELAETEVSDILLMASDVSKFNLNNSMKKITLSIAAISALGLPGTSLEHDENVVNEKIINLKSELDSAKQKIQGFEDLEKDKKAKLSADTVEADIKAGKIDATKKDEFIKLHAQSPDLYKSLVGSIPAKVSLAGQTVPTGDFGAIKSLDDFEKLDLTAQLEFKNSQPEAYKKLFS